MDLNRSRTGLARLFGGYSLVTGLVWILRDPGTVWVLPMVGLHLSLGVLFLNGGPRRGIVPLSWGLWLLAWTEIGWLYRLTGPAVHDGALVRAELALLGSHPHEVLSHVMPWAPVAQAMGAAYLSYYLLILGPVAVLVARGRVRDLAAHTLGLMTVYLTCFATYLVLPVLGPRASQVVRGEPTPEGGGVVADIMHGLFAAGDSLGTAFPSSHCAASVAAALLVFRHFGSRAGRVAGVWAGMIVVSTVYTGNHYALDALAGVALAYLTAFFVRAWSADRLPALSIQSTGSSWCKREGGRS